MEFALNNRHLCILLENHQVTCSAIKLAFAHMRNLLVRKGAGMQLGQQNLRRNIQFTMK